MASITAALAAWDDAQAPSEAERQAGRMTRVTQWAHRAGADYGRALDDPEWSDVSLGSIAAAISELAAKVGGG